MVSKTIQMKINFPEEKDYYGTLEINGVKYRCAGKVKYQYPKDITINTSDKEKSHYSQEFGCQLPYSIKLDGTRGIYIHQDATTEKGNLIGYPESFGTHGCINLSKGDAETVYNSITGRTRVQITYQW